MSSTTAIIDQTTASERETLDLAERFVRQHDPRGLVGLRGELGAGKTRFVRGVVRALGGDERDVSSPTFAIVNEYNCAGRAVAHVDAYRLTGEDELETIGWEELLDRCDILLIEWPQRIERSLERIVDRARYDVRIDHAGEHDRRITISRIED